VKTYRSVHELQAKVEQVLSRHVSPGSAPLDEVAEILSSGRHYNWIGIYLVAGAQLGGALGQGSGASSRGTGDVVPIRLGQHVYGAIEVRAEKEQALAREDRIFLKSVAARLANYLHGPGAALVRKAREAQAAEAQSDSLPARGHQPESEKAQLRSLAAGEGRR
jgi:putative methionine-R-sulfoxide reductase with GAF domain